MGCLRYGGEFTYLFTTMHSETLGSNVPDGVDHLIVFQVQAPLSCNLRGSTNGKYQGIDAFAMVPWVAGCRWALY